MNKAFITIFMLTSLSLINAFADQTDDLKVLMTDTKSAIMKSDFNAAITLCDQALTLDPNFAEAYANRAEAKGMSEDIDGALEDANKAIELTPDSPQIHPAYYVQAIISFDYSAEPEKALEFITKAIELNGDSLYYAFRSEIHEALGNQELAEADRAKAESVNNSAE